MVCLLWAMHKNLALSFIMASSTTPNWEAWNDVTVGMSTHRVPRSVPQIRAWWKAEKVAFHRDRAYWKVHGGPSNTPPDTYWQMYWLWCHLGCPTYRGQCYVSK